jgi:hypothetical protein
MPSPVALCEVEYLGDRLAQVAVSLRCGQVLGDKRDVGEVLDLVTFLVQDGRRREAVAQVEGEHPQVCTGQQVGERGDHR